MARALRRLGKDGGYGPGVKLPSERVPMGQLDPTRATLRKGSDRLGREGLLRRPVGKGT